MRSGSVGVTGTLKQKFPATNSFVACSLQEQVKSEEMENVRFSLKIGKVLDQNSESFFANFWEKITGQRQGKISAEIVTNPFDISKSHFQMKVSQKISRTIEGSMAVGLNYNQPNDLEVDYKFKYSLGASEITDGGSQVKLYLGFHQTIEEMMLIFGLKIAGIKFMFPLKIITQENIRDYTSPFILTILQAWFLRWYTSKKEASRIEDWKRSTLVALKNKYEDTLSLIKGRAEANQAQLRGRVFIMRAFYGSKLQIQKYLKRYEENISRITRRE